MSTDVTTPDRAFEKLHPLLRFHLLELFQALGKRKLAVFMTEGYRSPERQGFLYESGRTRTGPILTHAKPGQSYHNLIVHGREASAAADFAVWDEDRPWSKSLEWTGSEREWQLFTTEANRLGLVTLSFERPHVQLPHKLEDLRAGLYWPPELTR